MEKESNMPGLMGGIGGVVIALIAIFIGASIANMGHHGAEGEKHAVEEQAH